MKTPKWLLTVAIMQFLLLFSCTKDISEKPAISNASGQVSLESLPEGMCAAYVVDLWAGQTTDVGDVTIMNDNTKIYVKIVLDENFPLADVNENLKLWIGDDLALLPVGGGRNPSCAPQNGQFPYKNYTVDGNTYTFEVSFEDISAYVNKTITCNSLLYLVLHADMANGETAYAGDLQGDCTRWYFYTKYQAKCCETPPPPSGYTQTAFAKGGYVFTIDPKSNPDKLPSLNLTRNRWGWAINIPSTSPSTTVYSVWAGAGLNYTKNGTKVGTVTINWDGSTAKVTYQMISPFLMTGLHIYANDLKPTTIAPGQYGFIDSFNPFLALYETSFTLTDTNNDGLWFICHADVKGPYVK